MYLKLFILLAAPFVLAYTVKYGPYIIKYYRSSYKDESGVSLLRFLLNTGYFGEGLTFMELEKLSVFSKVLTNLYLPTEDGTTEIDLVYITSSGIYAIESKNYSGWIYGNEKHKNWTSVIYKKKYPFFNPIWQNEKHVKYLEKALGGTKAKSIIVFSERCEFKKLSVGDNIVIKRNQLRNHIEKELENQIYSANKVQEFYQKLKVYANQDSETKKKHIEAIEERIS